MLKVKVKGIKIEGLFVRFNVCVNVGSRECMLFGLRIFNKRDEMINFRKV